MVRVLLDQGEREPTYHPLHLHAFQRELLGRVLLVPTGPGATAPIQDEEDRLRNEGGPLPVPFGIEGRGQPRLFCLSIMSVPLANAEFVNT